MSSFTGDAEVWGLRSVNDDADDELLAPGTALPGDLEYEDESEEEGGDGGYGDPDGIVRLWLDGDRLTRVRVSARWREKLGRRTLDDCFAEAILMTNMRVAEVPTTSVATFDHVDFSSLPRVTSTSLEVFQQMFADVQSRWDQALQRRDAMAPVESPATMGRSRGVSVKLSRSGRIASVSFEEKWLEAADVVTIRSHVLRASRRAHARFDPPEDGRAELSGLEAEHRLLRTAFEAMLNPGRDGQIPRPADAERAT